MDGKVFLLWVECKWVIVLFVLAYVFANISEVDSLSTHISDVRRRTNYHKKHAIKSIKSEDGDIIDCIDIYKQPAFSHPALRNHKIQMTPSYAQTVQMEAVSGKSTRKKDFNIILTSQIWRKNASCPTGTIPIRRMQEKGSGEFFGKKGPSFSSKFKKPIEAESFFGRKANRSFAILVTEGYNYYGAKADMKVWTPDVEHDDEYSTSRIALENGAYYNYEGIESGWAVNPRVYGDKETRIYTYWTVDGSKKTGCFDLICPGFVQTSNEIALGSVIGTIPVPGGLPWAMTVEITKDPVSQNWWLHYQETITIGYWPAEIFGTLSKTVQTVNWGGEVYSSRIGHPGHTKTQMGSGQLPSFVAQNCGWTKRMRIRDGSMILKYPEWVYPHTDDWRCYRVKLNKEFVTDPEFYFGGPGTGWESYLCK